jgi:hypothetical protein
LTVAAMFLMDPKEMRIFSRWPHKHY